MSDNPNPPHSGEEPLATTKSPAGEIAPMQSQTSNGPAISVPPSAEEPVLAFPNPPTTTAEVISNPTSTTNVNDEVSNVAYVPAAIGPVRIGSAAADASAEEPLEGTAGVGPSNEPNNLETEATNESAVPMAPTKPAKHKSFWREVLETVILTILIFFLVKSLVQNFKISGQSMEPNFHTNQLLLVNKAAYFHVDTNSWLRLIPGVQAEGSNIVWLFGGPHRGDVIVLEPPDVPLEDYIKRVIGLPGEKVEVRDGLVYINDKPISEPYIKEKPYSNYGPVVVPSNSVFVMGDNRNASRDSRIFGFLPFDKIVGKAMFIYWPFGQQWGIVPGVEYDH